MAKRSSKLSYTKTGKEIANKTISLRVTPSELTKYKKEAQKMSLSKWIRKKLNNEI